jgi:hypothetical protein
MKFSHELRYDASPEQVFAMLSDPAFRERVCEEQRAHDWDVSIHSDGTTTTVTIDQRRPTTGMPRVAEKFVGGEVHIAHRETWTSSTSASLDVSVPHKPGHFHGTVDLAADGSGTVERVTGEVTVHIPLLGGRLEQLIADTLVAALETEQRVGRGWLAGPQ